MLNHCSVLWYGMLLRNRYESNRLKSGAIACILFDRNDCLEIWATFVIFFNTMNLEGKAKNDVGKRQKNLKVALTLQVGNWWVCVFLVTLFYETGKKRKLNHSSGHFCVFRPFHPFVINTSHILLVLSVVVWCMFCMSLLLDVSSFQINLPDDKKIYFLVSFNSNFQYKLFWIFII